MMNGHVKIVHSFLVLFIYDQLDMFFGDFLLFQILFDELTSFIRRAVVNVNYAVVVVVLHENWVKVSQIQSTFDIIVRGGNDTER